MVRKFGLKRAVRFKEFDFKVPKSKTAFTRVVEGNSKLSKVVNKIFSKKALIAVGAGTAIGYGIDSIWNYIESNSGCFKKKGDAVCKVRELSCCQPGPVNNVCPGFSKQYVNACDGYDEDVQGSCCKFCDCNTLQCGPDEEVQCQRPTVADALTHFTHTLGSNVWSVLTNLFPFLPYLLYAAVAVLFIWIAVKQGHVRKTGTLLPASRHSV